MITIVHELTVFASCHSTTKFIKLWTAAIGELSPLLEQDVTEDILKVCPRASYSFPTLIADGMKRRSLYGKSLRKQKTYFYHQAFH